MLKIFVLISVMSVIVFPCAALGNDNGLKVFPLIDSRGERDTSLLIGASESQIEKYVPSGKVQQQILAFLVEFNDQKILFDTGLGVSRGGHVIDELEKIGFKAADIKTVMLTHLHPDHFGGLVNKDGGVSFPNAEIYVSRTEKGWWFNEKKDNAVINALTLYEDKNGLHMFEFGDEVLNGITAIDASGHTPGHTAFHLKSGDDELLVIGDAMHFAEIQMPVPDISVAYDIDPAKAAVSRKQILNLAAEKNIPIAGMHITIPGLWRVKKSGSGYEKLALN